MHGLLESRCVVRPLPELDGVYEVVDGPVHLGRVCNGRGVTYTGTPSLNAAASTNAFGTFTTTGSNLGLTSGAVLGTGNLNEIPGVSSYFWSGPGTGKNGGGKEKDIAQLDFQFQPDTGVTKVVFQIVMGSEEYNEYVGQNFSDNIRILLTGGAYSNANFAVVPGTSTGIEWNSASP